LKTGYFSGKGRNDLVCVHAGSRSATAMIFVPLPRFVFPTLLPLFSGGKTGVDKCFAEIDCTSFTKFARKGSHDLLITPERTHRFRIKIIEIDSGATL
jgi:hypothetical protein